MYIFWKKHFFSCERHNISCTRMGYLVLTDELMCRVHEILPVHDKLSYEHEKLHDLLCSASDISHAHDIIFI